MSTRYWARLTAITCMLYGVGTHSLSAALDFPPRSIRMIVPQAAGSGVDLMTRIIAQKLTDALGQQVVVDNRPGANGIIGLELLVKSKPDGYTMALGVPSSLTMNPFIYKSLPYDTFRDLAPVIQTSTNTFGMVVNSSLPARSIRHVIALAKSQPGQMAHGSFGTGNMTHLAAALFSSQTGVKLLHVPFKGETPAVVALLSGEIAMMPSTATCHVRLARVATSAACAGGSATASAKGFTSQSSTHTPPSAMMPVAARDATS